jgi:hypothetical protein
LLFSADRASKVEISVAKEDGGNRTVVAYQEGAIGDFKSFTFATVQARYVRITLRDKQEDFHLCEVEVYGQSKASYLFIMINSDRVSEIISFYYLSF